MNTTTSRAASSRSGTMPVRILAFTGLVAATIYIAGMWFNLPTVELIAKGIPVLCLIVWLWFLPRDRFANRIVVGLVFSLVGDLILQASQDLFVAGLLSFLLAHLFTSRPLSALRAGEAGYERCLLRCGAFLPFCYFSPIWATCCCRWQATLS